MATAHFGFKFPDTLVATVEHIKKPVDGGLLLAYPCVHLILGVMHGFFLWCRDEVGLDVGDA